MYSPFKKKYNMKPNLKIAQSLKALDFLLKKSVLTTVVFFTKKKDSGGASIHRIDKSFPLKPSLA